MIKLIEPLPLSPKWRNVEGGRSFSDVLFFACHALGI